jgi:hypothetical protein
LLRCPTDVPKIITVMNEQTYYARNKFTGLYWNGKAFSGTVQQAKKVTEAEIFCLKLVWMNVEIPG